MEYEEMKEKLEACKTPEEMLALAKEVGHELTQDELDLIAGGADDGWESKQEFVCPKCGSKDVEFNGHFNLCKSCGYPWWKVGSKGGQS